MAIQSNIEWKLEQAFVTTLQAYTDLTDISASLLVRRWMDESSAIVYPCVAVDGGGVSNEAFVNRIGLDKAFTTLQCCTQRDDDATGEQLAEVMGAVRDYLRADSLEDDLSAAVDGLHVYAVELTGDTYREVDGRVRRGTFPLVVHATCDNVNESSSSSSSSS